MKIKPLFDVNKKKNKPINWQGSSDVMKHSLDMSKTVNSRLQILVVIICLLLSIVWVNLYLIQVKSQTEYTDKLTEYTKAYQYVSTPRGEILDRKGQVLVSNRERLAITYFKPLTATNDSQWELAYKFINDFEIDETTLKSRDLKDLFIILFPDEATAKITTEDWAQYHSGKLKDDDIYRLKLDRITDAELASLDTATRKAFVVKQAMDASPSGTIKLIKNDVSTTEVAFLVEHSDQYPGFDVAINWDRDYPFGTLLQGLLGSVSTSKQGLPADKLLYYLALGYARNDVIGKSGIELQYEDILKGQSAIYDMGYDNTTGLGVFTEVQAGSKGQDVTTSIDADLQQKIEQVITNVMNAEVNNKYRKFLNTVYVVAMNPKTGDVLSLAGMKRINGVIYNDPVSTYTESIIPGSAIKGATLYMGLTKKVVGIGEVIVDAPIKIKDTPEKSSYQNLGPVNDLQSLSKSSNVYMFNIAMRLGGAKYTYNGPLIIDTKAFDTMRTYFSQFGLGTLTGIDAANEQTGYTGTSLLGGHLLDFAIGQYDTYTPLQLAQYASTIANNGTRVKPRLVLQAMLSNSNVVTYQNPVTILSVLDDAAALKRVQMGFRLCVTDGLCQTHLKNVGVSVAAKTGTAQATITDASGNLISSPNSNLVAYAPYEDPTFALSCAVPNAWNDVSQLNICQQIAGEIISYYFKK